MISLDDLIKDLKFKECSDIIEAVLGYTNNFHTKYRQYFKVPVKHDPDTCVSEYTKSTNHISESRPFMTIDLLSTRVDKMSPDLISDFKCNVKYSILYKGVLYNDIKRSLSQCYTPNNLFALIYLDQPNMPSEILFSQTNHYFDINFRQHVFDTARTKGIVDGDIVYTNAVTIHEPSKPSV